MHHVRKNTSRLAVLALAISLVAALDVTAADAASSHGNKQRTHRQSHQAFAAKVAQPQSLTGSDVGGALDLGGALQSYSEAADPSSVAVLSAPHLGFPTQGSSYLYMSTGAAADPSGPIDSFYSTDLAGAPGGADGNDLTQVTLTLVPPTNATCIALDVSMMSEEFPEYVGSQYNDIFTAEINQTVWQVDANNQVIAPHNFAYDSAGKPLSINTTSFSPPSTLVFDGATPGLTAAAPVEKKSDGTMDLILSIQDLGDSIYDSAVFVDNVRWISGTSGCSGGVVELTDTDGDGLSDAWETHGIDYDGDGTPELDLPAMGADPQHKDIFVELDHMVRPGTCVWIFCSSSRDFAPQQDAVSDMVASFAAAPVSNPDGTTGIRVHADGGPGYVMNPVTGQTWGSRSRAGTVPWSASLGSTGPSGYDWAPFEGLKGSNFDFSRRDAFHYVVFADTYAGSGSSGISRGIPASDLLVTDGHSSWGNGFTRTQERGTLMHELGHNLNLYHGGGQTGTGQNTVGYKSIMNYKYQLTGLPPAAVLDYSRGAPYDDWANIRFDGGSVGDLGDSAPPPATTPDDSLTADEAIANHEYANDGDGSLSFVGPTVLIKNGGVAQLTFKVINVGSTANDYALHVVSPGLPAALDKSPVSVAPGATSLVTLDVDTATLQLGTYPIHATLSSGGTVVAETLAHVTVPNLDDPATKQAASNALAQLSTLPPGTGPNAAQLNQIQAKVDAPAPPPTSGEPVPVPGNTPAISGTPRVGETLTAHPGDWTATISTFSYQWLRDGTPIAGATGTTYVPVPGDLTHAIGMRVTAAASGLNDGHAEAAPVVVGPGAAPTAPAPQVTGQARPGGKLTVGPVAWSRAGVASSFQWLRDGEPVEGATGQGYDVAAGDVGRQIAVRVTGTEAGYEPGQVESGAMTVGAGDAPTPTSLPTVTGVPRAGHQLTATPGTWSADGLGFTFQWTRAGTAIPGATGTTYRLVKADAGRAVAVRVTAHRSGYQDGTATSGAVTVKRLVSRLTAHLAMVGPDGAERPAAAGRVSVPGVANPLGTLSLFVDGELVRTAELGERDAGDYQMRLGRLTHGGHRILVVYSGTDAIAPDRERFRYRH